MGLSGPVLLIVIAIGIGYAAAPTVKKGVKKIEHGIVHVVTLGKK